MAALFGIFNHHLLLLRCNWPALHSKDMTLSNRVSCCSSVVQSCCLFHNMFMKPTREERVVITCPMQKSPDLLLIFKISKKILGDNRSVRRHIVLGTPMVIFRLIKNSFCRYVDRNKEKEKKLETYTYPYMEKYRCCHLLRGKGFIPIAKVPKRRVEVKALQGFCSCSAVWFFVVPCKVNS